MKKILLLAAVAALVFTGCSKADDYPSVKTVAIYSDGQTVILIGNLTDDGDGKTTAGVCWDKEKNPYSSDETISKDRKKGEYTVTISDLEVGQEYYFRAYATNSKGTSYGNQFSFVFGEQVIVTGGSGGILEKMVGRFGLTDAAKLNVKGYINKLDFDFMRDGMPNLAEIDMSSASIATYIDEETSVKYKANNIPVWAFATNKGNNVLGENNKLKTIAFPESIWYIDNYAFANCKKLEGGIALPKAVQIIGVNAFYGCTALDGELVLYDKDADSPALRNIEEGAFNGCSGLKGTLDIPSSVTLIGKNAFAGCDGFDKIEVSWTTPPQEFAYADNMLPMKDVYVPAGSEEAYRAAPGWSNHTIKTK